MSLFAKHFSARCKYTFIYSLRLALIQNIYYQIFASFKKIRIFEIRKLGRQTAVKIGQA